MKRELDGQITILFERDGVRIDLHDLISGLLIASVAVDGPGTLKALARQGNVPCKATVYHTGAPIGYVCESKQDTIDFTAARDNGRTSVDPALARAVVQEFEVDGWQAVHNGSSADYLNHHRSVQDKARPKAILYRVGFNRYVEPHTGTPYLWPDRQTPPGPCVWTEESGGEFWTGTCGASWTFIDGGPADNTMKFCPGCGAPVLAKTALDVIDETDADDKD